MKVLSLFDGMSCGQICARKGSVLKWINTMQVRLIKNMQ